MRTAFINELIKQAKVNKNIELLTGDLGFTIFDEYKKECPGRYTDAGIMEQNMISVAAGMSFTGKTVVVYSIGNFATLRALEQIRNDCCYHNADVKIVSTGAFTYGDLGVSHHSTEDVSIFRSLPDISIFAPSDAIEAKKCSEYMLTHKGTFYLRIERCNTPLVNNDMNFDITKPNLVISNNSDIAIISYGTISVNAKEVANRFGFDFYTMPLVKPFDINEAKKIIAKHKTIYVVEENNINGGLGSGLCQINSVLTNPSKIYCLGIPDSYSHVVGSQEYQREHIGLSISKIMEFINNHK